MISLATATQHAPPGAADCQPESADGSTVQGHAIVAHMHRALAEFIAAEHARYGRIVGEAGIKAK